NSSGRSRGYNRWARVFSPVPYESTSPATNACVPHSANATTRAFGYADRLSPDPAYPNCAAFSLLSGRSTSNPSIANSRQERRNAPRAVPNAAIDAVGPARPATGPQHRSKISGNTLRPNRFRAWLTPLDVGTVQAAFQHPNRSNDPVTFVATSS